MQIALLAHGCVIIITFSGDSTRKYDHHHQQADDVVGRRSQNKWNIAVNR